MQDLKALTRRWTSRFDAARRKRAEWLADAQTALELVDGKQWTAQEVDNFGAKVSTANLIASTIEIMAATVFNRDPVAIVRPKKENYEEAELVATLLNYWYRELHLKPVVKGFTKTALIMAQSFLKAGYTKTVPQAEEETEPGIDPISWEPHHMTKETLWVEEVDPRRILIDPDAVSFAPTMPDARWVAQEMAVSLDSILDDDVTYPPELKKGLEKVILKDKDLSPEDFKVKVIEVYDKRTNKLLVFAENHDTPIRMVDYPFDKYEAFPFVRLVFRQLPFRQFPRSDVNDMFPLQRDLNRVLSIIVDHAQRQKTIFVCPDTVDDSEVTRFCAARNGEMVKFTGGPGQIQPMTLSPVSGEQVNALQTILSMIREQTGLSEYLRGGAPRGVQSATEAAVISQGDQLRLSDRREILEIAIRDLARYMYKLMRVHFTREMLIPIDKRASQWTKISPKEIRGEFDIQIETGSISPLDKSMEIGRATQVLNTLAPFIEAGIVKVRPMLQDALKAQEVDPDEYILTDQEASQQAQTEQALQQLQAENEEMKQALAQIEAQLQDGTLQVAKGDNRTAVPVDELQEEADQMVAGEVDNLNAQQITAPQEETNPLLEDQE